MSAQSVGDSLLLLAGQFQSEGSVTAAVHCLEAIAQAQQALLPLTEARARRQLAALLLAHTHNVVEAKAHLEKSVRLHCHSTHDLITQLLIVCQHSSQQTNAPHNMLNSQCME
jgi:hypothetical protein